MLMELFKKYKVIFEERRVCELGKWEVWRKRLVIVGVDLEKGKKYLNWFNEVFEVNSGKVSRDLVVEGGEEGLIGLCDKVLGMYDYGKLGEKKNVRVREVREVWSDDLKDEKKWGIKSGKMSSVGGV